MIIISILHGVLIEGIIIYKYRELTIFIYWFAYGTY